jgi:hypothetical protein
MRRVWNKAFDNSEQLRTRALIGFMPYELGKGLDSPSRGTVGLSPFGPIRPMLTPC